MERSNFDAKFASPSEESRAPYEDRSRKRGPDGGLMALETSTENERTGFRDRLATAPISWGICEVPGWGPQMAPERVLSEMQSLGFGVTELGSPGFFPEDATEVKALIGSYNLKMLGGFVPLVLHKSHAAEAMLAEAEQIAAFLAAAGSSHFITAPVTTPDWGPREVLSIEEWRHLAAMLTRVDEICVRHGLTQVLHPHVGTVVETAEDVQMVLKHSSVLWCLDTGHLHIGGTDPLAFAKEHFDRIGLVHLKDVVDDVVPRLNSGELSIMEAVQAGIFSNLGAGDIPLAEIVLFLEGEGYDKWYVVEQDTAIDGDMPAMGHGPVEDVARSLSFLKALEVQ